MDLRQKKKVLIVGDVMLDVYEFCYSSSSRPSPERPGTFVYTSHRVEKTLGGAGNVAANLTALGMDAGLISLCGNDGNYFELKQLADQARIDHVFVRDETRPTTIKTRLYIDDQYHLRRDDEKTHKINRETALTIRDAFGRHLDQVDAVILSDYNKGLFTEEDSQCLINLCRERDIPVVVDFKPANQRYFRNATVVAPNLVEARAIVPEFDVENPLPGLQVLHDQLGAENVLVTLGAHGMVLFDGHTVERIEGQKVEAIDPCGCGDTVRACLTLGLINGLSLRDAADFANYAASLVVQKLGTATLSPGELDGWSLQKPRG
jgi:D-beta-D-heptose 7-phosphate kinase/D-beta-D-heptose 1-phosphate adenosyltransferase